MALFRSTLGEEFNNLYRSLNTIKVIKCRKLRLARHVVIMQEGKSALKILTAKPTGKRPLGRPTSGCDYCIRMDLKEICVNTRNWTDFAQDRDYSECILNPRVP